MEKSLYFIILFFWIVIDNESSHPIAINFYSLKNKGKIVFKIFTYLWNEVENPFTESKDKDLENKEKFSNVLYLTSRKNLWEK